MSNLKESIEDELHLRIKDELYHFNGNLPERVIIAWRAYLAGLLEWGIIQLQSYDRLNSNLPEVEDDPSTAILKGRE